MPNTENSKLRVLILILTINANIIRKFQIFDIRNIFYYSSIVIINQQNYSILFYLYFCDKKKKKNKKLNHIIHISMARCLDASSLQPPDKFFGLLRYKASPKLLECINEVQKNYSLVIWSMKQKIGIENVSKKSYFVHLIVI